MSGPKAIASLCLALGLALAAASAEAQARCPWLNVATASGVLEGPAQMEAQTPASGQAVCSFRYATGNAVSSLRITVEDRKDATAGEAALEARCASPGAPLKAIGNEAVFCAKDTRSSRGEEVIGRVRDRIFTVTISTNAPEDSVMTRDALVGKVQNVAEQVAGALF